MLVKFQLSGTLFHIIFSSTYFGSFSLHSIPHQPDPCPKACALDHHLCFRTGAWLRSSFPRLCFTYHCEWVKYQFRSLCFSTLIWFNLWAKGNLGMLEHFRQGTSHSLPGHCADWQPQSLGTFFSLCFCLASGATLFLHQWSLGFSSFVLQCSLSYSSVFLCPRVDLNLPPVGWSECWWK